MSENLGESSEKIPDKALPVSNLQHTAQAETSFCGWKLLEPIEKFSSLYKAGLVKKGSVARGRDRSANISIAPGRDTFGHRWWGDANRGLRLKSDRYWRSKANNQQQNRSTSLLKVKSPGGKGRSL